MAHRVHAAMHDVQMPAADPRANRSAAQAERHELLVGHDAVLARRPSRDGLIDWVL
jgi:hypothetical protein